MIASANRIRKTGKSKPSAERKTLRPIRIKKEPQKIVHKLTFLTPLSIDTVPSDPPRSAPKPKEKESAIEELSRGRGLTCTVLGVNHKSTQPLHRIRPLFFVFYFEIRTFCQLDWTSSNLQMSQLIRSQNRVTTKN
jgi:hypothetical protein